MPLNSSNNFNIACVIPSFACTKKFYNEHLKKTVLELPVLYNYTYVAMGGSPGEFSEELVT